MCINIRQLISTVHKHIQLCFTALPKSNITSAPSNTKATSWKRDKLVKCLHINFLKEVLVWQCVHINLLNSNAKSTWKLLNDLINEKKIKCKLPSVFKFNEQEILNPTQITNRFCEYFTNIGPNLAKSIPASDKSHHSFLNGGFINSYFLQSASEQEVTEICSSFRSGTAPGYDSISMNVVKESFNLICAPLTYIINLSLNSGVVPQEMKIARVIPLFKSGDKSLFTNYRPVSVLPVFSKFLERIVYNRLINFLNKYDILSRNQYGFRKNYSTAHALIQLYDKISNALDNKVTLGPLIDLRPLIQ